MEVKLMVRLFMLVFFILLYFSWPVLENKLSNSELNIAFDQIQSDINQLKDNPEIRSTIHSMYDEFQQSMKQFTSQLEKSPQTEKLEPVERDPVELLAPSHQIFSIYNVELGQIKENIDQQIGTAKRSTLSEYGANWYAYHKNYRDFMMVMYDQDNKAVGLYTNHDLISSTNGIKMGSKKETVRSKLGEPILEIQKGNTIFQLQKDNDYDLYLLDGVYVTIFYDKHEDETVTAMQLISKDLEQTKTDVYATASPSLTEGFEYQLFDLTNAARVIHQLPVLTWDEHVRETARKHSTDMALKNYFNHTNLDGKSPFDRMEEDEVRFQLAGENLAYGQFSSIFAHEGLMNSLGHRKNILRKDFEFLGVGVAFNDESQPYYTQNFYAK
jgi:uncharacterized protein YkwD